MLEIVQQILTYIIANKKNPTKNELQIQDMTLIDKKGSIFVTLFKNGTIIGSAGNIIDIEHDIINELIQATSLAFQEANISSLENISIRVDEVTTKNLLNNKKITDINPTQSGIIVILKNYQKLAVILPNISPHITSGGDLEKAISKKLSETYNGENSITYEIETQTFTNY